MNRLSRRHFLQGVTLGGLGVLSPFRPRPLPVIPPPVLPGPVPLPFQARATVQWVPRYLTRVIVEGPVQDHPRRAVPPATVSLRRADGTETLRLVAAAGSMSQWVSTAPGEQLVLLPGDTIVTTGRVRVTTWTEADAEPDAVRFQGAQYEPGKHWL